MWTGLSVFTCYYLLICVIDFLEAEQCIKSGDCQCVLESTGTGINLNGIDTTNTSTSVFDEKALNIIFNPCKTVNLTSSTAFTTFKNKTLDSVLDECNDKSSICLTEVVVKRVDIGNFEDLEFNTDASGSVYLSFHSNEWTTIIRLHCDNASNTTDKLDLLKYDKSQKSIELMLSSNKSCTTVNVTPLNGGSSGSKTFFVIIFIIIFVYFVGGMLFKKIFLDAYGMEVLPNHLFWINVVESIVDAVQYVANGCKRPSSMYNEI